MENKNKIWKKRIKRVASRTNGTIFQDIGASKASWYREPVKVRASIGSSSHRPKDRQVDGDHKMTSTLDLFGGGQIVPIVSQNKSGDYSGLVQTSDIGAKFLEFWQNYPKRTGSNSKWAAEKSFTKLVKDGENPETIIAGSVRFSHECSRNGTGGRFVPMATTWLNQRRWKDDPDQTSGPNGRPTGSGNSFIDIAVQLNGAGAYHDDEDFGGGFR